jgi:hypothetical protein
VDEYFISRQNYSLHPKVSCLCSFCDLLLPIVWFLFGALVFIGVHILLFLDDLTKQNTHLPLLTFDRLTMADVLQSICNPLPLSSSQSSIVKEGWLFKRG